MALGVSATHCIEDSKPIHCMFGLTYGNYLVLQRSLMEAMPVEWQSRFVAVVAELEHEFDFGAMPSADYRVSAIDHNGRFISDPLGPYRHPDRKLIASLRRKQDEAQAGEHRGQPDR